MFTLHQGCPIFFSCESHDKSRCARAAKEKRFTDDKGEHSLPAIRTLAVIQEQSNQLDL
jgi:hypothetical protein